MQYLYIPLVFLASTWTFCSISALPAHHQSDSADIPRHRALQSSSLTLTDHLSFKSDLPTISNTLPTHRPPIDGDLRTEANGLLDTLFGECDERKARLQKFSERPRKEVNMIVAKTMVELASVAYCDDLVSIAYWNCSRCKFQPDFLVHEIVENSRWRVASYVGYHSGLNAKVIAFRGTHGTDYHNWLENLKFNQVKVKIESPVPEEQNAEVHRGFHRIWTIPFKSKIMKALAELDEIYGDLPVYVTGHSAGGATAQLCGFTLKLVGNYSEVRVYTFGSPRVGNMDFALMLSRVLDENWRFTHNTDPVPFLPWQTMGFWHSPTEVYLYDVSLGRRGRSLPMFKVCDGSGEDHSCHYSACQFGMTCSRLLDHFFYMGTILENDGTC